MMGQRPCGSRSSTPSYSEDAASGEAFVEVERALPTDAVEVPLDPAVGGVETEIVEVAEKGVLGVHLAERAEVGELGLGADLVKPHGGVFLVLQLAALDEPRQRG